MPTVTHVNGNAVRAYGSASTAAERLPAATSAPQPLRAGAGTPPMGTPNAQTLLSYYPLSSVVLLLARRLHLSGGGGGNAAARRPTRYFRRLLLSCWLRLRLARLRIRCLRAGGSARRGVGWRCARRLRWCARNKCPVCPWGRAHSPARSSRPPVAWRSSLASIPSRQLP